MYPTPPSTVISVPVATTLPSLAPLSRLTPFVVKPSNTSAATITSRYLLKSLNLQRNTSSSVEYLMSHGSHRSHR